MKNIDKFEITWLPLWKCNFKCPYCLGWTNTNALEFQPLNKLIEVWNNLLNKISSTNKKIIINISGGEPTIYPNIFELLHYFITRAFRIHVCTNFSFNAHDFLNLKIPAGKVFFIATFHPACISADDFINNLILLKQYIENNTINFVADENNLKNQKDFIKKINDFGIKVNPLFLKNFGQDPRSEKEYVKLETLNSGNEINLIKEIKKEQNLLSSDYESARQSSFGKKCLAGYKHIQIFPNGNIRKCSMDSTYLGNIFDDDLNLYTEPQICKQKICPHQYSNIVD